VTSYAVSLAEPMRATRRAMPKPAHAEAVATAGDATSLCEDVPATHSDPPHFEPLFEPPCRLRAGGRGARMGRHAIRLAATTALERVERRCHFPEATPKLTAAATSTQASSGETSVREGEAVLTLVAHSGQDGTTRNCNDRASRAERGQRVKRRSCADAGCTEQPRQSQG